MDHAGHDHSSHAPAPGGKQQHPEHGSYPGHAIPGTMFIIWSVYWLWSILDIHLRRAAIYSRTRRGLTSSSSNGGAPNAVLILNGSSAATVGISSGGAAAGRSAPASRRARTHPHMAAAAQPNLSWYPWPFPPCSYLEPLIKATLPLGGVLVELYIGWHFHWRPMKEADGHLSAFHANNWQHAMMYGCFALSGLVELLGVWVPLPSGTEQGFLSLAFLCETLLMGLHAKHNPLDALVHRLLTWLMLGCAATMAAEVWVRGSTLLALAKTLLVFLQGTWFWHVGRILYLDNWAWDMNAMSSVMYVPVVFCCHIMITATMFLTVYVIMRVLYARAGLLPRPAPPAKRYLSSGGGPLASPPAAGNRGVSELELADLEWGDDGWGEADQEAMGLLAGEAPTHRKAAAAAHRAHH